MTGRIVSNGSIEAADFNGRPGLRGPARFSDSAKIQMPEEASMLIRFPRLFESLSRPVAAMREHRRSRQSRQQRVETYAAVATERLEARALLTVTGSGTFIPRVGVDAHTFVILEATVPLVPWSSPLAPSRNVWAGVLHEFATEA